MRTPEEKKTVSVIGGGSWATALVKILSEKDLIINWWLRSETDVNHIKEYKRNPSYLTAAEIDTKKVNPTTDLHLALKGSNYVIFVVPAAFIADVLDKIDPSELADKKIISATKGMIPKHNLLVTEYIENQLGVSSKNIAVIAGPCHAEEVAMEKQSYLAIASDYKPMAKDFANLIQCRYIKATPVYDILGVEYSAVMKNIIAVACGIAHGLNYGDNFQAVLVTNSLQEIKAFVKAMYQTKRNWSSTAYLGDLLVTTYSQFSRNRTFGNMIGRGYTVKAAQIEMEMVAEGYYAVKCVNEINKQLNVHMPITNAVFNILYEKISPMIEFKLLKDKLK